MDAAPATPFQAIRVRTAARLDRLEDVLVLLSQQALTPKTDRDNRAASGAGAAGEFRRSGDRDFDNSEQRAFSTGSSAGQQHAPQK